MFVMDAMEIGSLVITSVLGFLLLLSYVLVLFMRLYAGGKNESTVQWLWAGFSISTVRFVIWCISALCATVSYLIIFARAICMNDTPIEFSWYGFSVCNVLFLLASLYYPWVMLFTFESAGSLTDSKVVLDESLLREVWKNVRYYKKIVILDLFVVAASAGCMAYFVYSQYGTGDVSLWACIILTFHCTIIDLLAWGYTWYSIPDEDMKKIYHETFRDIIHVLEASMDTDPSTMGVFSRLRIRQRDVQIVTV